MLQCWVASERAAGPTSAHGADAVVSATRQELSEGGADVESAEPPLLPAGATLAGRDSHPLRNGAFARRTINLELLRRREPID